MKNILLFNYGIDTNDLLQINSNIYTFYLDYQKYYFVRVKRAKEDIDNIYKIFSLVLIYLDNDDGFIDSYIIHELNHVLEVYLLNFDGVNYKYYELPETEFTYKLIFSNNGDFQFDGPEIVPNKDYFFKSSKSLLVLYYNCNVVDRSALFKHPLRIFWWR